MKLLNISFTKPRYLVLGLALAAGAGTAQAQFTGIGTTNPSATLHVTPVTATDEVLRVNDVKAFVTASDSVAHSDVLLYAPSTGLFRRESLTNLLDKNSEWFFDGTNLVPRRIAIRDEVTIADGTVGIGNNLTVGGNGSVAGTLAVTGNGTFTNDLTVNGNTALATGAGDLVTLANLTRVGSATVDVPPASQVLLRNATTNAVEYAQLDDIMRANGMWVENAAKTELLPRVTTYAGTIGITADSVNIKKRAHVGQTLIVDGATSLKGTLRTAGATDLRSTLNVEGNVTLQSIPQRPNPILKTDEILMQRAGAAEVEYVTVDSLLQSSGEWRFRAAAAGVPNAIYANRARAAGQDIVATETGRFGIGTTNPSERLQVVGGNVRLDAGAFVQWGGATNQLTNTGLTVAGAFADVIGAAHTMSAASSTVTTTGTIVHNAGGPVVTLNANGLGIGVVAIAGRHLQTNLADGIQFGSLTPVTDVVTAGLGTPASVFERVLITDGNGVVRYIDADDLMQASGEWRFEASTGAGNPAKIYANRARTAGSEVWVTEAGNHVVELGKAYQWAGADNQITNTGITASAAYTIRNGAGADFGFYEGATGTTPWLFHKADPGTTEIGRVGINTDNPQATLHVAGNIVASNSAVTSDRRFKENIVEISNALNAVKALRGVSYKFRATEFPNEHFDRAAHLGFIAQEVREVLPQTVFERADGFLTVDYGSMAPVLVEAMQELAAKVEALEAENAALRSGKTADAVGAVSTKQLRDLEARLAAMDARLEAATAGRK